MMVSTKGRYALRIMVDLAENQEGGPVSLKDIAERENIGIKYLEIIVSSLNKNGLLKSVRGKNGGYMLNREPKEYTIASILNAAEGSLAPVACAADSDCCEYYCDCVTSFIWTEIYKSVIDVVSKITLKDLVEKSSTVDKSIELECKK